MASADLHQRICDPKNVGSSQLSVLRTHGTHFVRIRVGRVLIPGRSIDITLLEARLDSRRENF